MKIRSRVDRLEAAIKPHAETLAEALGGLVLDALPGGRLRLPDGREMTRAEFDELAAQYPTRGPRHILVMDEDERL